MYMTHRTCILGALTPSVYSRHAHSTHWTSRVMRTWQCAQFTCTGSLNWRWLMRPNATRILCPFTGQVFSVIGVCVRVRVLLCVCPNWRWLMRPNATRILCPSIGRVFSVMGVCVRVCMCVRVCERECMCVNFCKYYTYINAMWTPCPCTA